MYTHRLVWYSELWHEDMQEATLHRSRRFERKELTYSVLYLTTGVLSTIPRSLQFQRFPSHIPDCTVS